MEDNQYQNKQESILLLTMLTFSRLFKKNFEIIWKKDK